MIHRKQKYRNIARTSHRTYKKKPSKKRTCKNCGCMFNKQHNRQIYCKKCQPIVQREQHNEAQRRYHKKWKSTINRRRILKPGTNELPKNIYNKDWEKEAKTVKKELKRVKYPYNVMYSKNILGF